MPSSPPKKIQLCCGCGKFGPLVKSHIIPESFCKRLSKPKKAARFVGPGTYAKRAPIGVYDTNILCDECEKKFGVPDDYAFTFLYGGKTNFESIFFDQKLVAEVARNFDFKKLKLFLLSVIWRASVSKSPFCSGVDLGAEEKRFRDIVLYGAETNDNEYSICCGKLVFDNRGGTIPGPFDELIDGVKHFRIYTGEYLFWIKVDAKPTPAVFFDMVAKPNQPLIFLVRDIKNSPEIAAARQALKMSIVKK